MNELNQFIELYKEMHKDPNKFPGTELHRYVDVITSLINETDSNSLVDFGCGKGYQYIKETCHENWGMMPTLYDPGVPEFSSLPIGVFDGLISTDVMEHIPESGIDETLQLMFSLSNKFILMSVALTPARAILPNGKNAHCTIQPQDWWIEKIQKANTHSILVYVSFMKYQSGGDKEFIWRDDCFEEN